ncbi:hypothetical protein EKO04_001940 [Ascochyta lentis]|uniref:Uncharacterized protein n=1 Tax=Ascochyta lentis TaxID=205686 RepID=A0A8H7JCR7_9PLEO|nr:hypothetical protein EKO04_001940 [Ascochyta lentis]
MDKHDQPRQQNEPPVPQYFAGQEKFRPPGWKPSVLKQPLFDTTPDRMPQITNDADRETWERLAERNQVLTEALLQSSWETHCAREQLAANREGMVTQQNQRREHARNAAAVATSQDIALTASKPILESIVEFKATNLDTLQQLKSEVSVLLDSDLQKQIDLVKDTMRVAVADAGYKGRKNQGAVDHAIRDGGTLLKRNELHQRLRSAVNDLENHVKTIDSWISGEAYSKQLQDAAQSAHDTLELQLAHPLQKYADEEAMAWGYNRGFFEGMSFSHARQWARASLDHAFWRGFAAAEGSMAHELARDSDPWKAYAAEHFTRGYHASTSYHLRRSHNVGEDVHRQHHLKQASAYGSVFARDDNPQPYLDVHSLACPTDVQLGDDQDGYFAQIITQVREDSDLPEKTLDRVSLFRIERFPLELGFPICEVMNVA